MSQDVCAKCEENIKKEKDGIACDGGCSKVYHTACVHLQAKEIELIKNNENIQFICDVCQAFCLKTINNKLNGIYDYLYKLNERTIETLNLVKESNENQKKSEATKVIASNENDTEKKSEDENTRKRSNAKKTNGELSHREKRQQKRDEKIATQVSEQTPTTSNRKSKDTKETAKRDEKKNEHEKKRVEKNNKSAHNNNVNKKFSVVVRPKNVQSSTDTIKHLNSKCKPNDLNINNIVKTKSGLVIFDCETAEQRNEVKNRIESSIGDDYEINSKEPLPPKIKILGITEEMTENEIETQLKRQNGFISKGDIKVLKVVKDWKTTNTFNAIVRVDKTSFKRLMERKKVLIHWNSCAVKEHFSIVRCHKCSGFNHLKEECRNKTACGYCGKEHETDACDEETVQCINCVVANDKYTLNLDTNHNVWSSKCQILKKKVERVSKRTEYAS